MEKVIGACGIDCSTCECREATLADDNEKRQVVAEKWSQAYEADLKAADINCHGCMEAGLHFGHCNECEIRSCVRGKGLLNCAGCGDYACAKLEEFFGMAPVAKENLEALRS